MTRWEGAAHGDQANWSRAPQRSYLDYAQIAVEAITLNLTWLLGCATVIGAPASTSALLAAVRRWRATGEAPSLANFIHDARQRFLPDLLCAVVLALAVAVAVVDLVIIGHMGVERRVVLVLWFACTAGFAIGSIFIFAVASLDLYEGTGDISARRTITGSWRLAVARPFSATLTLVVIAAAATLLSISPIFILGIGAAVAAVIDVILYGRSTTR